MSLLPYLVNDILDDIYNPSASLCDQFFGLPVSRSELTAPRVHSVPLLSGYLRPWRNLDTEDSGVSNIQNTKDDFKVSLDVQQFKPEEVKVKVSGDYLVIEGDHEERQDKHGYISRRFTRRYKLPDDVDLEKVKSSLSSDGVLTLEAPKKVNLQAGDRQIPITHTNRPALKNKKTSSKTDGEKMES